MRYDKLSPALAAVADDFNRGGRAALDAHRRSVALVTPDLSAKPARVVAFLHTSDAGADLDHLTGLGVEVDGGGGAVRTELVPLDSLDALSEDPAISRIVPARPLRLLMDVASGVTSLGALRSRTGLTGKGVVIGIVDSGIEVGHDSFVGRIHRLWDQTLSGQGVPEGRYGAELKGSSLELSRGTVGHGTHVAGIAAAAAVDELSGGVAPAARLVIVKTDLLLERDRTLDPEAVRQVLRTSSAIPGGTPGQWDPKWGCGLIDARSL